MKYRGIELREGNDSEAELLVNVEVIGISDEDELEEYVEDLEDSLIEEVLDYDNLAVYTETVTDNLIQVRSNEITFDQSGIDIITDIYNDIKAANLQNVAISVGIHVDGEVWFKDEKGEYNEDAVSLEDFLAKIEF